MSLNGCNMEYDINRGSQKDSEDNHDSYIFGSSKDTDVHIKNQMKLGDNCEEEWLQLLNAENKEIEISFKVCKKKNFLSDLSMKGQIDLIGTLQRFWKKLGSIKECVDFTFDKRRKRFHKLWLNKESFFLKWFR